MSRRFLAPLALGAVLVLGLFVRQRTAEAQPQGDGYSLTCRPVSLKATHLGLSLKCSEGSGESEVVITPGSPLFQATPALVTMAQATHRALSVHVRPTPQNGPVADSLEVQLDQLVHESPYGDR